MYILKTFGLLSLFAFAFILCTSQPAQANNKYASIVIDASTGTVLRERNADKKLYPASMTKMMTLYMVFDAIDSGKLKLDQRIWVSPHAASMVPSKLDLKPRSTIRVKDAIYALVTKSANDVAVTLGEAVSGSEAQFARDMTKKARALGMKSTTFKNASGLHHRSQVSTARDISRLSQALIYNHPKSYAYFKTNNFKYRGKTYKNHNKLLKSYTGMDGIKTGYVNASGFNLAASAKRNGRRLIGVVFGGRSSNSRNAHMAEIMDEGFLKVGKMSLIMVKAQPLPSAKPDSLLYASLQRPGQVKQNMRVASVTGGRLGEDFKMLGLAVGEGDQDTDAARQVLASVSSMSKTNGGISAHKPSPRPAKAQETASTAHNDWSVQIGAFDNKESSTNALKSAAQKLPRQYVMQTKPQIVKAKSGASIVYRARFSGLSREKAVEGCKIIKNCIVLASAY